MLNSYEVYVREKTVLSSIHAAIIKGSLEPGSNQKKKKQLGYGMYIYLINCIVRFCELSSL